jgi:hypothetical protein
MWCGLTRWSCVLPQHLVVYRSACLAVTDVCLPLHQSVLSNCCVLAFFRIMYMWSIYFVWVLWSGMYIHVFIHVFIYLCIYSLIIYFIYIIYTASIHLSICLSINLSINLLQYGLSQIEIEICKFICFLTSYLCSLQIIFYTCVFAFGLFLIISSFIASTAFSMVSWLFSYRTAAGFHVETLGSDLPVATETQPHQKCCSFARTSGVTYPVQQSMAISGS